MEKSSPDKVDIHYYLKNEWQFWVVFARMVNKASYEIEPIIKVNQMNNFCKYFKSLPQINELVLRQDNKVSIALFKDDITPAWEHEKNKNGGELLFFMPLRDESVNKVWEELLLCAVSNQMDLMVAKDDKDLEINGLVVAPKKAGYSFEIWTNKPCPECPKELKKFIEETIKSVEPQGKPIQFKITAGEHGKRKKK